MWLKLSSARNERRKESLKQKKQEIMPTSLWAKWSIKLKVRRLIFGAKFFCEERKLKPSVFGAGGLCDIFSCFRGRDPFVSIPNCVNIGRLSEQSDQLWNSFQTWLASTWESESITVSSRDSHVLIDIIHASFWIFKIICWEKQLLKSKCQHCLPLIVCARASSVRN